MAGTTVEVTLKQDIYDRLERRVRNGEAANLSELIQRDIEFTLDMVELDDQELKELRAAYDEMEEHPERSIPIEDICARYGFPVPGSSHSLHLAGQDDKDLPLPLATFDPQRPTISATEQEWEDHVIPARLAAWEAGDRRTFTIEEVGAQLIALRDKLQANKAA